MFFFCWVLIGSFIFSAEAQESPFPGLMIYLEKQYASPFQVAGKVKELSENRLLFSRGNIPLERGQRLWICEHRPGISPPLQRRVARIRVEVLFSDSVLGRVEQVVGRPIEPDDWVLTPPAPAIHLFSNIEAKHTFLPYQQLLKSLIAARFQVQEVAGDTLMAQPDAPDLLLRLEGEAGHLVCQLIPLTGGQVLYSESLPYQGKIRISFPPGHALRRIAPMPVIAPPVPPAQTKPSFKTLRPLEKTDFYQLPEPYLRVVHCDLEGDAQPEQAFLGKKGVVIYRLEKERLIEKARYPFIKKNYLPLHLHAMDLDGDGGDEILVTLAEPVRTLDKTDNHLCSQILTFKDGKFQAWIKNWPYYLRVIQDRKGRRVALAQAEGNYEQYAGPIYQVLWNQRTEKVKLGGLYKPATGIYSIYQFNLVPEDAQRVIILEPNDDLNGYSVPSERVEVSGVRNYGRFSELAYPLKLEKDQYLGGFDKKTYRDVYAPRRFELRAGFDGQSFLIYKERGGGMIKSALKRVWGSAQGMDQVVGVKWMDHRIIESWQSKKLAKDILDFTFVEDPDRILVLYRDGDGYALEALY